jgi:hypothetical protein
MGPGMTTKLVALTAVLTVAATSVAHADEPPMAPLEQPSSDVGPKNPDTALMLSLGGTAASAGLVLAGISGHDNGGLITAGLVSSLVTPSLGEWYAGKPLTAGMGIRAASAVVTIYGVAESLKCLDFEGSDTSCHESDAAGYLLAGGLIGYAAGTIYDIATAPSAARAYNREHAIRVQPSVIRTPAGSTTMGVGIGGSF